MFSHRLLILGSVALSLGCGSGNTPTAQPDASQSSGTKSIKQEKVELKGGGAFEVVGEKQFGNKFARASAKGSQNTDEVVTIEIDWPVTQAQYNDLKKGMSTFRVKNLLELKTLDLTPNSAKSRFVLVCKDGAAKVTLEFSGYSDVEVVSKSAQGLK